jgi:hypothetical protein
VQLVLGAEDSIDLALGSFHREIAVKLDHGCARILDLPGIYLDFIVSLSQDRYGGHGNEQQPG